MLRRDFLSLAAGSAIEVVFVSAAIAQYIWYKRCDALGPLDLGGMVVARECVEPTVLELAVGFTSIAAFMAAYLLLRVQQDSWKAWQRVLLIVAKVLGLCLVAPALPLAWNFLVWVGRHLL
jgi:hypothetical protein